MVRYQQDQTVLCYHGVVMYEAKIISVDDPDGEEYGYKVHFNGWSKKHDEWVFENRLMENTPANQRFAKQLMTKALNRQKSMKSAKKAKAVPPPPVSVPVVKKSTSKLKPATNVKRKLEQPPEEKSVSTKKKKSAAAAFELEQQHGDMPSTSYSILQEVEAMKAFADLNSHGDGKRSKKKSVGSVKSKDHRRKLNPHHLPDIVPRFEREPAVSSTSAEDNSEDEESQASHSRDQKSLRMRISLPSTSGSTRKQAKSEFLVDGDADADYPIDFPSPYHGSPGSQYSLSCRSPLKSPFGSSNIFDACGLSPPRTSTTTVNGGAGATVEYIIEDEQEMVHLCSHGNELDSFDDNPLAILADEALKEDFKEIHPPEPLVPVPAPEMKKISTVAVVHDETEYVQLYEQNHARHRMLHPSEKVQVECCYSQEEIEQFQKPLDSEMAERALRSFKLPPFESIDVVSGEPKIEELQVEREEIVESTVDIEPICVDTDAGIDPTDATECFAEEKQALSGYIEVVNVKDDVIDDVMAEPNDVEPGVNHDWPASDAGMLSVNAFSTFISARLKAAKNFPGQNFVQFFDRCAGQWRKEAIKKRFAERVVNDVQMVDTQISELLPVDIDFEVTLAPSLPPLRPPTGGFARFGGDSVTIDSPSAPISPPKVKLDLSKLKRGKLKKQFLVDVAGASTVSNVDEFKVAQIQHPKVASEYLEARQRYGATMSRRIRPPSPTRQFLPNLECAAGQLQMLGRSMSNFAVDVEKIKPGNSSTFVSKSVDTLMDSFFCSLGPLLSMARFMEPNVEEMADNSLLETLNDNCCYFIPID